MWKRAASLFGLVTLALLLAPFGMLAATTDWPNFHFALGDGAAAFVSVGYSLVALPIIALMGTPLAMWLARSEFRGKWIAEIVLLLPLLTPPLAMGLMLATLYGPFSIAGRSLAKIGILLTNSPAAFILAQVYGATPYFVVSARAAFEAVPVEFEQIGLTLGKSGADVFFRITLPLAKLGLASGLALAWIRALGELGIVLIIAYYPQGIPIKLWVNLQDIGLDAVYPLLWLFFLVALPVPLWLGLLSRRRGSW